MDRFTKYLRRNLDVISDDKPITFAEELEHTKNYLWLEQLRFKKNLNVEYSIDCEDFLIPPLTIQPIVENAIKHGITKKIGGGKVSISVREADKYYKITISDDGVGFDKAIPNGDKDPHIGIEDVRRRLNRYNGSTLTINSVVGVGTSAVYQIQK
jgi:sensor histidine kinase YesM